MTDNKMDIPLSHSAPRNAVWSTLRNREAIRCFSWVVIQQAVVAASTYLLVLSARFATSGSLNDAAVCALGFALLLVLVYIPNTASLYYLQRWRIASLEQFVALFLRLNSGKTTLRHPEARRQHESLLTNEAQTVFEHITGLRYELSSTVLSALFNVAVIGLVVAPGILIWYGLAGLLLALSSRLSQARIQSVAVDMQDRRKKVSGVLLGAWENIFSGNPINVTAWTESFDTKLQALRRAALRYDLTRSTISGLTVSAALLLISIGNAWYFLEHRNNLASLTTLLITLPRQLQTVQHIFAFFNVLISYKGIRQQFEGLGHLLDLRSRGNESLRHIDFEKINVFVDGSIESVTTPVDFLALLKNRRGIRVTLRAPNGAGKSTLIAYAAEQLYPNRVFIPSYTTEFEFPGATFDGLSDGSRAIEVLKTLGEQPGSEFILIDEWDANLDAKNVELINQQIVNWVRDGRTVLESRHRSWVTE